MITVLAVKRPSGAVLIYTESGALPMELLDVAKPSRVQPPVWIEGRGWWLIVPRTVGTAPILTDWTEYLIDYDHPVRSFKFGRHGTRVAEYLVQ